MGILGKQLEIYMNTDFSDDWKFVLWLVTKYDRFEKKGYVENVINLFYKKDFLGLKVSCEENISDEKLVEYIRRIEILKKLVVDYRKEKALENREILDRIKRVCDRFVRLKRNSIHSLICHQMFDQIKKGKKVYVYIDNHDIIPQNELYMSAFINAGPEIGQPVAYYHCSMVTEAMQNYDQYMFEQMSSEDREIQEVARQSYKPYSVEFVIPVDRHGKTKGNYKPEDEDGNRLEEYNSEAGWFLAEFRPIGAIEGEKDLEESSYVEGRLITIASPPKYMEGKLLLEKRLGKFSDDEIDSRYKNIKPANLSDVSKELILHASDLCNVNVYNIGHGNFITLGNQNNKAKVVYDIGHPMKNDKEIYESSFRAMRRIEPELIIISHWDTDHFSGAYRNKMLFDIPWIAPKAESEGQINAKRIMVYLNIHNRLHLVERKESRSVPHKEPPFAEYIDCYNNFEFRLHQGYGKASPITDINCQGIVIEIGYKSAPCYALLCGDVPYNCLSEDVTLNRWYEYVVIPHHGSTMNKKSYNALDQMSGIRQSFICERSDHPLGTSASKAGKTIKDGEHYKKIDNKTKYQLLFTDDDSRPLVYKYRINLKVIQPVIMIKTKKP